MAERVIEKAPEITACAAITVAAVASAMNHGSAEGGTIAKSGLAAADGSLRTSAPCPR